MSKYKRGYLTLLVLGMCTVCLHACAGTQYLRTEEVDPSGITGTYTLLLHGGRYGDDMQNVAILDREGDLYTFELYAPEFDYKVMKGVPARDAVARAERFVRFHYAFWKSRWSSIIDGDGSAIGYEVRPLYLPLDTGFPDVLDITYFLQDHKVIARIRFKPDIEKALEKEQGGPVIIRPMK